MSDKDEEKASAEAEAKAKAEAEAKAKAEADAKAKADADAKKDPHAAKRANIEKTRADADAKRKAAEKAIADAEAAEHALAVATTKPSKLPSSEDGWYTVKKRFHGSVPHLQKHGIGAVTLEVGQRVHRKYHPLEHWVENGLQVEAAA